MAENPERTNNLNRQTILNSGPFKVGSRLAATVMLAVSIGNIIRVDQEAQDRVNQALPRQVSEELLNLAGRSWSRYRELVTQGRIAFPVSVIERESYPLSLQDIEKILYREQERAKLYDRILEGQYAPHLMGSALGMLVGVGLFFSSSLTRTRREHETDDILDQFIQQREASSINRSRYEEIKAYLEDPGVALVTEEDQLRITPDGSEFETEERFISGIGVVNLSGINEYDEALQNPEYAASSATIITRHGLVKGATVGDALKLGLYEFRINVQHPEPVSSFTITVNNHRYGFSFLSTLHEGVDPYQQDPEVKVFARSIYWHNVNAPGAREYLFVKPDLSVLSELRFKFLK